MNQTRSNASRALPSLGAQELSPHYLGFFKCFNGRQFFEAHEVLEQLWLTERKGPNDSFYKGLIQVAGAFVHLQKDRLRPAAALFKLARNNFVKYPGKYLHLDLSSLLLVVDSWLNSLERNNFTVNPLSCEEPPMLALAKP